MSDKPQVDFTAIESTAAHNLTGQVLKNGWIVVEKLTRKTHSTGSFFSVCYRVEKEKRNRVSKSFRYRKFFHCVWINWEKHC